MIKKIAGFVGFLACIWTIMLYHAQENGGAEVTMQQCNQLTSTARTECVIVASEQKKETQNLFVFALLLSILSLTVAFWPIKHAPKEIQNELE